MKILITWVQREEMKLQIKLSPLLDVNLCHLTLKGSRVFTFYSLFFSMIKTLYTCNSSTHQTFSKQSTSAIFVPVGRLMVTLMEGWRCSCCRISTWLCLRGTTLMTPTVWLIRCRSCSDCCLTTEPSTNKALNSFVNNWIFSPFIKKNFHTINKQASWYTELITNSCTVTICRENF